MGVADSDAASGCVARGHLRDPGRWPLVLLAGCISVEGDGEVPPGSLAVRPGREASCADGLQKCLAAGPRAGLGAAGNNPRPGGLVLLPGAGGGLLRGSRCGR
jgi:hypothetical protein